MNNVTVISQMQFDEINNDKKLFNPNFRNSK